MILEDEANVAAETPLPPTPVQERTPLGEVTGNLFQEIIYGQDFEAAGKPAKKSASTKGRKAKAAKGIKKGRVNLDDLLQESELGVVEDDDRSSTSSAVEEACRELMKESSGGRFYCDLDEDDRNPNFCDVRPQSSTHARSATYNTNSKGRECCTQDVDAKNTNTSF